ncbi:DUF63 family protein [Halobaculum sp. MBLA0143]|uniref:DUF63 family protein n=1 Tax=Halobaculum sp. MBLA0143 TaxID=3079933 RepID=UPI0035256CA9
MATVTDRVDTDFSATTLWVASAAAVTAVLGVGSLLAPETFYDGFLWHYFWGPVQADAQSAVCAVRPGSTVQYLYSSAECAAAAEPVAYPGYTVVSEVGYAVTLVFALSGVVLLLRRLEIAEDPRFFYAMVPFFFLGGALRVVEDADNASEADVLPELVKSLLISPIIYFTLFFLTLTIVAGAVVAVRRGLLPAVGDGEGYETPILVAGSAVLAGTLGYLLLFGLSPDSPGTVYPQVIATILIVAVVSTVATWYGTRELLPSIHGGTGAAGVVVVFAHALDGAANVIGLDYMVALGAGPNLVPKHPVNQFVVDVAGAAWPFLLVKLAAAVFVLSVLDEPLFEESPRYAVLLLIAVTAVGLGPGTRDMLRATIGV